jgi:hypothetical protein
MCGDSVADSYHSSDEDMIDSDEEE